MQPVEFATTPSTSVIPHSRENEEAVIGAVLIPIRFLYSPPALDLGSFQCAEIGATAD
jgi:hypothetical protein